MRPVIGKEEISNPLQVSALSKKGLCDYVVNIASGCLHGCTFCYVPSTPVIRMREQKLQTFGVENPQMDWGSYLFTREDVASKLSVSLGRMRSWKETPSGQGVVMLCSTTDPYQNAQTAAITREAVKVLLHHGKRIRILTRSPIWVNDLDLLCHPNVIVGMSLPHLDDAHSRLLEPNAPLPSDRLKALTKGYNAGCRLFIALAPTSPIFDREYFRLHLSKLMNLNPEVIFWEPINPRGTNGKRMLEAGIGFVQSIMERDPWAQYFLKQWEDIEWAADHAGGKDRLHIWPDKGLEGYADQSILESWWNRPTVEKWP
jgi:DNA repair photolyase